MLFAKAMVLCEQASTPAASELVRHTSLVLCVATVLQRYPLPTTLFPVGSSSEYAELMSLLATLSTASSLA